MLAASSIAKPALHFHSQGRELVEASSNKRVIDRATNDLATIQQRPPAAPAQSNLENNIKLAIQYSP
jgi:hypothetical protein